MKRTLLSFLLVGCTLVGWGAKPKKIINPPFAVSNQTVLKVSGVILSDTATVVEVATQESADKWVPMAKKAYMESNGKRYALKSIVATSGAQMIFEPIDSKTERLDVILSDEGARPRILGIELKGKKLPALVLDDPFLKYNPTPSQEMPKPIVAEGKSRLTGRILEWQEGLDQFRVTFFPIGDRSPTYLALTPDANGRFSLDFDLSMTQKVLLMGAKTGVASTIVLTPGEDQHINVSLREASARQSNLRSAESPSAPIIYSTNMQTKAWDEYSRPEWSSMLKAFLSNEFYPKITGMNLEQYAAYWDKVVRETDTSIKANSKLSSNAKRLARVNLASLAVAQLQFARTYIEQAYRKTNKITDRNAKLPSEVHKIGLPTKEQYAILKELPLDDMDMLLANIESAPLHLSYILAGLNAAQKSTTTATQMEYKPSDLISTEDNITADVIALLGLKSRFSNFDPLTDGELSDFRSSVKHEGIFLTAKKKNNELLASIEANKSKSGYTVVDLTGIAPDKVFSTILERHKGKVIFLDFWATWCGPCVNAMELAKPAKAALKGKDIVYVYITSSSPEKIWKNMIPDIPGEHYFLSKEQGKYLSTIDFQYNAIPSYAIIGRDGKTKHFQTGFMGAEKMKELLEKEL